MAIFDRERYCTDEEAKLVTEINGYNEEALNCIIYARLAYHDVEQLYACARNEFDFSMCHFLDEEDEDSDEEDMEEV